MVKGKIPLNKVEALIESIAKSFDCGSCDSMLDAFQDLGEELEEIFPEIEEISDRELEEIESEFNCFDEPSDLPDERNRKPLAVYEGEDLNGKKWRIVD